jgi:hypothetical protein
LHSTAICAGFWFLSEQILSIGGAVCMIRIIAEMIRSARATGALFALTAHPLPLARPVCVCHSCFAMSSALCSARAFFA